MAQRRTDEAERKALRAVTLPSDQELVPRDVAPGMYSQEYAANIASRAANQPEIRQSLAPGLVPDPSKNAAKIMAMKQELLTLQKENINIVSMVDEKLKQAEVQKDLLRKEKLHAEERATAEHKLREQQEAPPPSHPSLHPPLPPLCPECRVVPAPASSPPFA